MKKLIWVVISFLILVCSCTPSVDELIQAINENDNEKLKGLLENGATVKYKDSTKNPLIIAIKKNDIAAVKLLLDHGANPNTLIMKKIPELSYKPKYQEMSILYYALVEDRMDLAKLILGKNVNVNYVPPEALPLPFLAILHTDDVVFNMMLKKNIDSDLVYKGNPLFFYALDCHSPQRALCFLNEKSIKQVTPSSLWFEIVSKWEPGSRIVADKVLGVLGSVSSSKPLLNEAIIQNKYECVKWLLDKGLDPEQKVPEDIMISDEYYGTPLQEALVKYDDLTNYRGKDFKYDFDHPEVIESKKIISLLEESIQKSHKEKGQP